MAIPTQYQADVEAILARRHDNGADYWATPDGKLNVGSPFTTLECAYILPELGMEPSHPVLRETADLIFAARREDGRFKLFPKGAIYPCHTINAARTLCYLGHASDPRLQKTFEHLLAIRHSDGGWRCNKFSFGRGPETEFSNPGPTLAALDAFRFTGLCDNSPALDSAAEFLLAHWTIRKPLGPCHYGIGTLFMQVTYPFRQLQPVPVCLRAVLLRQGEEGPPLPCGAGRAGIQADQRPDRRGTPQPKAGRVRLLQKRTTQRTRHPPLPRAIAKLKIKNKTRLKWNGGQKNRRSCHELPLAAVEMR